MALGLSSLSPSFKPLFPGLLLLFCGCSLELHVPFFFVNTFHCIIIPEVIQVCCRKLGRSKQKEIFFSLCQSARTTGINPSILFNVYNFSYSFRRKGWNIKHLLFCKLFSLFCGHFSTLLSITEWLPQSTQVLFSLSPAGVR